MKLEFEWHDRQSCCIYYFETDIHVVSNRYTEYLLQVETIRQSSVPETYFRKK